MRIPDSYHITGIIGIILNSIALLIEAFILWIPA